MTCQEFVELVTAYLEDALPDAERVAFEGHLQLCPGCEYYLAQFRQTIQLLGALPQEALSAPGRQRLLDAFADWRGETGAQRP
jgi:anti-sigma factor RsiW